MEITNANIRDAAHRIKAVRKTMNLRRDSFAELLSVSTSHLTNIENGRRSITLDNLMTLKRVCGVSADYILFGSGSMFSNMAAESEKQDIYSLTDDEKIMLLFRLYEYFSHFKQISVNDRNIEIYDFIQKADERLQLCFCKQYKDTIKISDKW